MSLKLSLLFDNSVSDFYSISEDRKILESCLPAQDCTSVGADLFFSLCEIIGPAYDVFKH